MKYKVFVDGQEGTTGLKINERLSGRADIDILKIDPERRKDPEERRAFLNNADIAFLCLPDDASRESAALVTNNRTKIIDASTAHRTDPNWTYGIPELSKNQRALIKDSHRVAVPGCHATGFNMALYPLIQEGIVPKDYPVTCQSVTGYSGGGKKLIEKYEGTGADKKNLESPQFYALSLKHKHLPEMQKVNGLVFPPLFTPIVGDFYQGMVVAVPLLARLLSKKISAEDVQNILASYYASERFVRVMPYGSESYLDNGFLDATGCNNTNRIEIFVFGDSEQILLLSRLDNLGKGASGAAVQNMNIMLGLDEGIGLE
ncbi:MAG: N-acetyl-gamma-glutamyl-phosphate reductase [Pelotomaculum sp. PtaB.Bin013]|uniref:N-acetyl-gamma-glutamyl-phosphate reductase n=1 Tax=Pelotomaculum isophthalicicum JI TaxID=947010 RepID=A0A9X4H3K7_9FIRM|nr:N-acetyl-gamma-glutamyl-phosphate reductase [Pelotomaculum isophthalicicum]MDF9408088.1 N-acetyl-gamma-glutamyl-phosphate reductase [Pelotomaculum isophthalicicum JI]OPX92277.1 MAG: N-acetyl-gamma-glutamyl-phosphate reductase [Pelotomaculum sp. PtaB.Bin013]